MTRNRWLLIAGACAIGVAILAWQLMLTSSKSSAPPSTTQPIDSTGTSTRGPAATSARPNATLPAPTVVPGPEMGSEGLSTDDPLTAFKKQNVYPPSSRPLTPEHADLLRPNTRHETPRSTDAADGTEFLFTADRYFVVGTETITPILEVRRKGVPVVVSVHDTWVVPLAPNAPADAPRYAFEIGKPFAPSTIPNLARQTALGMYVQFDLDGRTQGARFDFQYTPERGIPARFTGKFSDEIVDGSLVIHAGVDVAVAGNYLIDCNLFDARDQPVAWTRTKVQLAAGAQRVDLVFFGKVLVDQQASGAFHIGQLRGARFAPGLDPDLEQMLSFTDSYTTREYKTSELSDAEYDSEHKRQMIQMLEEQKARGVHQGAASGR
ncbi:MAG: hypothetical protein AB7T06_28075 [Kofleriaceae bacterium]